MILPRIADLLEQPSATIVFLPELRSLSDGGGEQRKIVIVAESVGDLPKQVNLCVQHLLTVAADQAQLVSEIFAALAKLVKRFVTACSASIPPGLSS